MNNRDIKINGSKHFAIIVPVLNGGTRFRILSEVSRGLSCKTIVIDSGSTDGSDLVAERAGLRVIRIDKSSFNHGGTRQWVAEQLAEYDVLVYMTQDVDYFDPLAIEKLVRYFEDPLVGVVSGRQLPHLDANVFAAHGRICSYPDEVRIMSLADKDKYGIKSVHTSNSFCAYRRSFLLEVGGFPNDTILSEDMYVAAKMLLAGYKVVYAGDACVRHSHNYTIWQEFKRYFDQGVFHGKERWIQQAFGKNSGAGKKYVLSELKYLIKIKQFWLFPEMMVRTLLKYFGYKLGNNEKKISVLIKNHISMNKNYWKSTNR